MAAYGMETLYQDRPKTPISSNADTTLQYAQVALSQIISDNESDEVPETKLGLSDSGRIALDIIKAAQVSSILHNNFTETNSIFTISEREAIVRPVLS